MGLIHRYFPKFFLEFVLKKGPKKSLRQKDDAFSNTMQNYWHLCSYNDESHCPHKLRVRAS